MASQNANKPATSINDKSTYVARDQIWKDHINKMNYSAKKWPENWGFMNGKLEDIAFGDELPSNRSQQFPTSQKQPEKFVVSNSPRPMPKTTAGLIGWRSTDELFRLEKYGRYTKGKSSILKSLNWPNEAIS